MILKTDCSHFPGDRPCKFNKNEGIICSDCNNYKAAGFKILIIKLDATGDVLRTTSIIPGLKKKYPDSHITWLTKRNAAEIFFNNSAIDRILIYEEFSTTSRLMTEEFDILIHTDSSANSAALASIVKAKNKFGFVLNAKGQIEPLSKAAEDWLEMGAFDNFKKLNTKSYQEIIYSIAEMEFDGEEIQLHLSADETKFALEFSKEHKLSSYKNVIGLNTGAGSRWQFKQWTIEGYSELIGKIIAGYSNVAILLYGGEEERERNDSLKKSFPFLIDTGSSNSLRKFFALLSLADIIVTGDTMALHAACALQKDIICLFGPTSSNEIAGYNRVRKIIPDLDCLVCYKQKCHFNPSCMEMIKPETVFGVLEELLNKTS